MYILHIYAHASPNSAEVCSWVIGVPEEAEIHTGFPNAEPVFLPAAQDLGILTELSIKWEARQVSPCPGHHPLSVKGPFFYLVPGFDYI